MKMEITARIFEEADYPIVIGWWKAHNWGGVPLQMLPKLGVIMSNERVDICAGWVYMDNSVGVCMLEWIVTNPEATNMESYRAIKEMVNFLSERVREMDYGVMITTCAQESLARFHEKVGFKRTDSNMIHLVKFLMEDGN